MMTKTITKQVILLSVLCTAAGCNNEPKASNNNNTSGPVIVFSDEPIVNVTLDNAPTDYQLFGRLTSPGGMRELVLVVRGDEQILAEGCWLLPPVGVMAVTPNSETNGGILVCWNELTGPEPSADAIPAAKDGLVLMCRYREPDGVIGNTMTVSQPNIPTWLRSAGVMTDGSFVIDMIKDKNAILFGLPQEGDGWYSRVFDGASLGDETAVRVW